MPEQGGLTQRQRRFPMPRQAVGILRQGLLVLADQCGYSLVTLVVGILLARSCSKDQYGLYVLAMTFVFFSRVVLRSLVSVPFSVQYFRCPEPRRAGYLAVTCLQLALTGGLMAGLVAGVALAARLAGRPLEFGLLLPCLLLLILCDGSADFLRTVLITRSRLRDCWVLSLAAQGFILLGLLGWWAAGRLTVPVTVLTLCGGYGIFLLGGLRRIGLSEWPSSGAIVPAMQVNLRQGGVILSGTLIRNAGLQFLPWLTLLWWDRQMVAVVGVLTVLTGTLRPLLQSLVYYLTPRLSELMHSGNPEQVRSQTLQILGLLVVPALGMVGAMGCFGDFLVKTIYGAEYGGYRAALVLFTCSSGLRMLEAPLRAMINATGRSGCLVTSGLAATALSLLSAFVLIPAYGVTGIALVHVLYNLAVFSLNGLPVFRKESLPHMEGGAIPL